MSLLTLGIMSYVKKSEKKCQIATNGTFIRFPLYQKQEKEERFLLMLYWNGS